MNPFAKKGCLNKSFEMAEEWRPGESTTAGGALEEAGAGEEGRGGTW